MIRSTPSWSGSGNMTPASMRIVVSSHDTAIMFMPNSPRPPSGDDFERRRRHVRYSGLIHSEPSVDDVDVSDHEPTLAGRRGAGSTHFSKRRDIRPLGAPDPFSRSRDPIARRRKNLAGSTTSGENYSTALREPGDVVERSASRVAARRSSPARCKEIRGRMPERVGDRLQRVHQRLPPLQEHAPDQALEDRRGSPTSTAGGRKRSRTTADVTFGGGRNAPGGRRQDALDVGDERHLDRPARRSLRCRAPPRADRPPPSAASASRREAAARRRGVRAA